MKNADNNVPEGRICRFGFKMMHLAGLNPEEKKGSSIALARLTILPPFACVFISFQQLFFGKRDLDSFARNAEACGVYIQVSTERSKQVCGWSMPSPAIHQGSPAELFLGDAHTHDHIQVLKKVIFSRC